MLDRLQIVKQRFDEISDLIIQPDVISDQKRYVQLNQEYKGLKALAEKRDEYVLLMANIDEANEIIADGSDARAGSLTADRERFLKWRSVNGEELDPHGSFGHAQTLIEGLFNKRNLLDVIQYFTIFVAGKKTIKMFPGYHQFYAVTKAYHRAITASQTGETERAV